MGSVALHCGICCIVLDCGIVGSVGSVALHHIVYIGARLILYVSTNELSYCPVLVRSYYWYIPSGAHALEYGWCSRCRQSLGAFLGEQQHEWQRYCAMLRVNISYPYTLEDMREWDASLEAAAPPHRQGAAHRHVEAIG